jgi:hypothetical protein
MYGVVDKPHTIGMADNIRFVQESTPTGKLKRDGYQLTDVPGKLPWHGRSRTYFTSGKKPLLKELQYYNVGKKHGRYMHVDRMRYLLRFKTGGYNNGRKEGTWTITDVRLHVSDYILDIYAVTYEYLNGTLLHQLSEKSYSETVTEKWGKTSGDWLPVPEHLARAPHVYMFIQTEQDGQTTVCDAAMTKFPAVGIMGMKYINNGVPECSGYYHYSTRLANTKEDFFEQRRKLFGPIHEELVSILWAPEFMDTIIKPSIHSDWLP